MHMRWFSRYLCEHAKMGAKHVWLRTIKPVPPHLFRAAEASNVATFDPKVVNYKNRSPKQVSFISHLFTWFSQTIYFNILTMTVIAKCFHFPVKSCEKAAPGGLDQGHPCAVGTCWLGTRGDDSTGHPWSGVLTSMFSTCFRPVFK